MAGSAWTNQVVSLLIVQTAGNFQGIFLYSPTPAAGNLFASVTASSGTDPYGNTYDAGFTIYQGGATMQVHVGAQNQPAIDMKTGAGSEEDNASLYAIIGNKGLVNEYIELYLGGPGSTFDGLQPAIVMTSSGANGSLDASIQLQLPAGTPVIEIFNNGVHFNQTVYGTGGILAVGDQIEVPGETWHAVTTAGWTGTLRVQLMPWNAVWIDCHLTSSGGTSGGAASTFGSLPSAAYYPSTALRLPLAMRGGFLAGSGSFPGTPAWLFISTSGAIQAILPPLTASVTVSLDTSTMYPTN